MKININTNINNNFNSDEIEVIINAKSNSETLNKIIENIQSISDNIDTIIGSVNNSVSIINVNEVICFYSKGQSNFCRVKDKELKIKKKLYELEENLDKNSFIRISNSCIVNIKFVESFDLSKIGDIVIKFVDGTKEYVSKRKIANVMKFLKERGN